MLCADFCGKINNLMKRIETFIIALLISTGIFAQGGSIKGKITDGETGEELIGATVQIAGTTRGAAADLDGNYQILGLDAGTYTIVCSYISYESDTVKAVVVKEGQATTHDFIMGNAGIKMEEFVVVARANKGGNNYILNAKQESATLLDGISQKEISRGGDTDVAGAVKRVTGVTVEGGKYVYVRGLSDRYSKTLLNGAVIPSLDPRRNSVQMDLFPTTMIDNVAIYKTTSPELPGDFAGGLVNINTKDYPEDLNVVVAASLGYNTNATFNSDYATGNTGSKDWLGMDDGTRAIPDIVQNNEVAPQDLSSYDLARQDAGLSQSEWDGLNNTQRQEYLRSSRLERNSLLSQQTQSFNKDWKPVQKTPGMNQNYALSIGNKVDLFNGQLGFNVGMNYKSQYEFYDDGITGRYKLTGNVSDVNSLTLLQKTTDTRGDETRMWSVLGNLTYLFNKNNQLGFVYMYNQNGQNSGRYQNGVKPDDDPNMFINIYQTQYIQRDMSNMQLKGNHTIPALGSLAINWVASRSESNMQTPDLRVFTNDYFVNDVTKFYDADGNDITEYVLDEELNNSEIEDEFPGFSSEDVRDTTFNISQNLYPAPTRYFREMNEVDQNYLVNFTLPFNKGSQKESKVMFGGSYVHKDRYMNERRYSFIPNGLQFNGNSNEYFSDENMVVLPSTPSEPFQYLRDDTELRNSYTATESDAAAYAMVDWKITKKFKTVLGARVETTNILTQSLDPTQAKGELDIVDVLPSINVSYALTENMNLKAAATQSLARPTFRELAPFTNYDFEDGFTYVGNPNLERALIDNIDLRWEMFPKSGEILSVSGFYKKFDSPIEKVINPEAANVEITWKNVERAMLYGFELEARKNLGFIWSKFQHLNLGANFTYVKSETTIDEGELEQIKAQDPGASDTRPMFGQAPYVVNAFLNYDNPVLGLEANVTYNVNGPRLVLVIQGATPDIYEQSFNSLNFNITKTMGKHFKIRFAARNILNDRKEQTYTFKDQQYDFQSFTLGQTFSLSIKYTL
jgi:TonB-dependent receptor